MKSMIGRIAGWLYRNLIWDPPAVVPPGVRRILWATRKLLIALALTALLTWREWVEHHPPEIVLVTVIHFVFVMVLLALLVRGWDWINAGGKKTPSSP